MKQKGKERLKLVNAKYHKDFSKNPSRNSYFGVSHLIKNSGGGGSFLPKKKTLGNQVACL